MNNRDFNFVSSLRGFRIITRNIRSLPNKFPEFECIVVDSGFEVICGCESWLNKNIHDNLITVPGYNLLRLDRCVKRKGGGLCIYIHEKLKYDYRKYQHLNLSNTDFEIMFLCVLLPCCFPIVIANCYRPPSGNSDQALNYLSYCLVELQDKCELFVLGDFNLDYSKPRSPSISKLKVLERTNHLKQYKIDPTRIVVKSMSIIDHIYSNSHVITHSGVISNSTIDYFPCFIVRKKVKLPIVTTSFVCRKVKHFGLLIGKLFMLKEIPTMPGISCINIC